MEQEENTGISLWKKGKQGVINIVFSRLGLILVLFIINILLILGVFKWFSQFLPHFVGGVIVFIGVMVVYLFNCDFDSDVKLTWLMVIMLFPFLGALFLLYTRLDIGHRAVKARMQQLINTTGKSLIQDEGVLERLKNDNPESATLVHYVGRTGCYPVYENTEVTYFPLGEYKFEELLKQLEQAKKFIFLEYFIHAVCITYRSNKYNQIQFRITLFELLLHIVSTVFVYINNN